MGRYNPAMSTAFDFTRIPDLPPTVYVAPLRKPDGLGADWLEPAQRRYSAAEHRIWDDLFARQIELMPGRACSCLLYTSPSPRDRQKSRMPSSA
jgi:hypothetical protein